LTTGAAGGGIDPGAGAKYIIFIMYLRKSENLLSFLPCCYSEVGGGLESVRNLEVAELFDSSC
jgi:ABC-type iron transport system FetAB permease component